MRTILLSCVLGCLAACAFAQTQLAPKKTLHALRISEKIQLDGLLDEAIWQQAEAAEGFVFNWPTPGKTATQRTEVRILYDDQAVYIGAHLVDSQPDSIFHRLGKRDDWENTDAFTAVFDTYMDGQNAVKFGVSPDNVQADSKFSVAGGFNGGGDGEDPSWDAVWQSAARITADGWVAEMAIPYSALRFPKKAEQRWSVNFFRSIKRHGEYDCWNEVKAEIQGELNQMGILEGIANIKAPLRLSATPFVAAYVDNQYNLPGTSWNFPYTAGMDLKYGLNEAFTLDATIVPDFGQVRSDNFIYNLTPFEVQFDENRPFFTEGTELFNKGGFFYSRRVGAAPIRLYDAFDFADSAGLEVVKNPSKVQLLNATKISGRTKNGLGIGVFNALENATHAVLRDPETGAEMDYQTSSLTNRNILVLDQNLPNNSSISLINTSVLRSGSDRDANLTGLVFNLKDKAQRYALRGKAAYSTRIYPSQKENGYTAQLDFSKTSGELTYGGFVNVESETYNPRDMGFLFSPNELSGNAYVNFSHYKPWKFMNNFWSSVWVYAGNLYAPSVMTDRSLGGNFGFNTKGFHNFGVNISGSPGNDHDYFEPRTGDFNHFYAVPSHWNINFWYNSDHRKPMTYYLNGGTTQFSENDRARWRVNAGVRWRASDKLTLGIGSEYMNSHRSVGFSGADAGAVGYDQLPDTAIVFGHRNVQYFDNSIDGSYSFNNRMNLALFVRHYWQTVEYQSFEELQADGSLAPTAYTGRAADGSPLHDVAANYFNVDLVFTWRFAPGSDLLLVYKNGIFNEGSRGLGRDYFYHLGQLGKFEGTNSLSMKVLYYLDYNSVVSRQSVSR